MTKSSIRINYSLSQSLKPKLRFIHTLGEIFTQNRVFRLLPRRYGLAHRISKMILPALSETILCPTIFDFDLVVTPKEAGYYYTLGFYEAGTLDFMKKYINQGDTFVDIGASVGMMTMMAAKLVGNEGRVLAFEPQLTRFTCLNLGVKNNSFDNIKIFKYGLSDRASQQTLFFDGCSPTFIHGNNKDISDTNCEIVDTLTLDSIIKRENIKRVSMIKIDVEGFEERVLRGAKSIIRSHTPPIIFFEKGSNEACLRVISFIQNDNQKYSFLRLKHSSHYRSELIPLDNYQKMDNDDMIFCMPFGSE
jgi:FkbM family methyltransferase